MPLSLLIDFGATRIKSCILNQDTGVLSAVKSRPFPKPLPKEGFEVSVKEINAVFSEICKSYHKKYKYQKIFICSQMHGFALQDGSGAFVTDFISWQDERCLIKKDGVSSYDIFTKELSKDFKQITGMRLRAGFPAVKVLDLLRNNKYKTVKVLCLPEVLCLASGKSLNKVHSTMAQGSGAFDFKTKKPSDKILALFKKYSSAKVLFNTLTNNVEAGGYFIIGGQEIPIYTGVGDHQCAILGAGNTKDTFSVNIGTGSQVSRIQGANVKPPKDLEVRYFFNDDVLFTITHIPAGRVLKEFMDFLGGKNALKNKNIWRAFTGQSLAAARQGSLNFDLGLFDDAYRATGKGGAIMTIRCGDLNLKNFMASLFISFARQYVTASAAFGSLPQVIVLSGGKLAKNNLIKNYLSSETGKKVKICKTIDETLTGLKKLAVFESENKSLY